MSEHQKPDFKRSAAEALADPRIALIFDTSTRRKDDGRRQMMPELGDPFAVRTLAAQIKNHTLQNLDRYLEQFVDNVRKHGGQVYFAQTGEQARDIITGIAERVGATRIVKSKSMVSEEIELNDDLISKGRDVVETDLGEYILQLAGEKPSHIVTPVAHKSKEDVGRLFQEKLGIDYSSDPPTLTMHARRVLRAKFKAAEMGIIGANFAVAETGTLCTVTNEGNGRFCASRPRVLVCLMGMEKVIPRMKDLAVFLKLLARSATGQRVTCYTNLTAGPKRSGDFDGPEEFHLVIMDRSRTRILGSEHREALRCIRCGACLNACPVYRKIGGHAYETVYPGPIGSLITPLLSNLEDYEHLPQACSLCGACHEACPVRIDFPLHLIQMRGELVDRGRAPWMFRVGFKFWRIGMRLPFLYRWGAKMFHWFVDVWAHDGWHHRLPAMGSVWTEYRDCPTMADRPFHRRWKQLKTEIDAEDKR